jgi:hypothetical protein
MNTISVILGWVLIALIVVLFTDVVGVVRVKVYKERRIWAELIQRKFIYKSLGLLVVALIYIYLK